MLFEKTTSRVHTSNEPNTIYSFTKEGQQWFIDLPDYIARGGSKFDLLMVEGADTLLNFIANGKKIVTIQMDRQPFDGAEVLELVELCEAPKGGGYYVLHTYNK